MSDKQLFEFVDSNILVYAYDSSAGEKNQIARQLLLSLWEKKNGCLSIQTLQEFYVCITQKVPNPISQIEAAEIIKDFSVWKVHSPNAIDLLDAVDLQKKYKLSFWDAMIIKSAISTHCEIVWSEDLNKGQLIQGIKICNPFNS